MQRRRDCGPRCTTHPRNIANEHDHNPARAFPGSDAVAPPGSMGQVSNRQAESLLRRKYDLHVAYWNVQTLQDVGVQALTMRELLKYNVDIACLSEV